MTSLDMYQHVKEAATLLAVELDEVRERQKKVEAALREVFPYDFYKQLRPDVDDAMKGEDSKIMEHFIDIGIGELNIKEELQKNHNFISKKVSEGIIKNLIKNCHNTSEESDQRKREFLQTVGSTDKLCLNENHIFSLKHTSLHYASNAICTWIPKNGCSSLRYSIAKANGAISSINELEWIHNNGESFSANSKEILQANYTFVFLRNPFKRLLSFFGDKLCHQGSSSSVDQSYKQAKKTFEANDNTSFCEFVNYIWENPQLIYKDIHTKPQNDFLIYRKYDDYFTLENYPKSVETILAKSGLKIEDIRDQNSIYTTKGLEASSEFTHSTKATEFAKLMKNRKCPIPENMYTNDLIKKVATMYLHDILLYQNKSTEPDEFLNNWLSRAI